MGGFSGVASISSFGTVSFSNGVCEILLIVEVSDVSWLLLYARVGDMGKLLSNCCIESFGVDVRGICSDCVDEFVALSVWISFCFLLVFVSVARLTCRSSNGLFVLIVVLFDFCAQVWLVSG